MARFWPSLHLMPLASAQGVQTTISQAKVGTDPSWAFPKNSPGQGSPN